MAWKGASSRMAAWSDRQPASWLWAMRRLPERSARPWVSRTVKTGLGGTIMARWEVVLFYISHFREAPVKLGLVEYLKDSAMLPVKAKLLFGMGALGMFVGWLLFFRMMVELNRVLPPDKRLSFREFRMRIPRIRELHETSFPLSTLRAWWLGLMVGSAIAIGAAVIVGIGSG